VHLPASLAARLPERLEELLSILPISKNRLAPVAPAHQVVAGAGILDS
jgi:hypothetical protein